MTVVAVGSGVSFLAREEEKQCDHSTTAVSSVLPEYSVSNLTSGYGGVHQCSHTEGKCFMIITRELHSGNICHSNFKNQLFHQNS